MRWFFFESDTVTSFRSPKVKYFPCACPETYWRYQKILLAAYCGRCVLVIALGVFAKNKSQYFGLARTLHSLVCWRSRLSPLPRHLLHRLQHKQLAGHSGEQMEARTELRLVLQADRTVSSLITSKSLLED